MPTRKELPRATRIAFIFNGFSATTKMIHRSDENGFCFVLSSRRKIEQQAIIPFPTKILVSFPARRTYNLDDRRTGPRITGTVRPRTFRNRLRRAGGTSPQPRPCRRAASYQQRATRPGHHP